MARVINNFELKRTLFDNNLSFLCEIDCFSEQHILQARFPERPNACKSFYWECFFISRIMHVIEIVIAVFVIL